MCNLKMAATDPSETALTFRQGARFNIPDTAGLVSIVTVLLGIN
jgi:hypothetical protein